jgi:hypothetical protein
MTIYPSKFESILSVFDINNKTIDIQQTYSPLDELAKKTYNIDTVITGNVPYYLDNKVYMALENETVETDLSLVAIDLVSSEVTKTPLTETDAIKLCSSENKACRVDAAGNVYDLVTGELYTTIDCVNKYHISNTMDDINNNVIYISNDGYNIISQGTGYLTYPLASGITFGSGEVFGLTGGVVVYSASYFSPTRRVLYVIHD